MTTKTKRLMASLHEILQAHRRLQEMLSDAIDGGRLTEADIPDDYQAIVGQLTLLEGLDPFTEEDAGYQSSRPRLSVSHLPGHYAFEPEQREAHDRWTECPY